MKFKLRRRKEEFLLSPRGNYFQPVKMTEQLIISQCPSYFFVEFTDFKLRTTCFTWSENTDTNRTKCVYWLVCVWLGGQMMVGIHTFGVEGDEAVTQRPFVHRLIEDDILWEDDHGDVLKLAQPLQNLSHWLGLGLFHHATDSHHNLLLWGLNNKNKDKTNK